MVGAMAFYQTVGGSIPASINFGFWNYDLANKMLWIKNYELGKQELRPLAAI